MISEKASADDALALFVDGEKRRASEGPCLDVVNPSNRQSILTIPRGSPKDADAAVCSARNAFDSGDWNNAAPSLRKRVLLTFAELIEGEAEFLDALDAGEMGKPVGLQFANARTAASLTRFYAEAIDKVSGDVYPDSPFSFALQTWRPRGVVAAVTPWNFPTLNVARKIAPALAAGNSVVVKPSEYSTRSAIRLAELAVRAGLPSGVFNVTPGLGETAGRALALHDDVDMVTFTGSTTVGKMMLQYAGQSNLKVVLAECGGKSPHIVFDDAPDLEKTAASIASFLITNQGQICTVGSRLLVQQSIEKRLLEAIVEQLRDIAMGDALDPKTSFGPLASAQQYARVSGFLNEAPVQGAELVCGGRTLLEQLGGYFVEPTVFRGVSPQSALARKEVFGPVLAVTSFHDEEDAVRLANDNPYGLAAYVWTTDLSRGLRMAKSISSSVLIRASANAGEGPGFAGASEPARLSGIGTETGLAGLHSYQRRHFVSFSHA